MTIRWTLIFAVMFLMLFSWTGAQASPAMDLMQRKEKVVQKILAKPTEKGTPGHEKKEAELRSNINELFDFEELGKRSLDHHWLSINDAQRKEFIGTLQALIEKNYLLQITKSTTYQLKWFGEMKEGESTTVRFKIKSGKYKAAIQLRTIEKAGKPVVYDMLIDDVSLMENYRSQFNRIIKKNGFDELLKKMKKKLNDDDDSEIEDPGKKKDKPAKKGSKK